MYILHIEGKSYVLYNVLHLGKQLCLFIFITFKKMVIPLCIVPEV